MPQKPVIKERRAPRTNQTSESQEEINRKRRAEKLAMDIADNFRPGDWYLTLTYGGGPGPDREKVPDDIEKFVGKLRRRFKRAGVEFRWIRVVENLAGRGRPHAHLLIPAEFAEFAELQQIIAQIWPHGHAKIEPFGGRMMDAVQMASYFSKEKVSGGSGRISSSRNLVRRKPTKKRIGRAETYRDEIKPPAGYEVIKALSYNGWTRDGYPCQRIVCEKIERMNAYGKKRKAGAGGPGKNHKRAGRTGLPHGRDRTIPDGMGRAGRNRCGENHEGREKHRRGVQ
jgi:hypothetical protein